MAGNFISNLATNNPTTFASMIVHYNTNAAELSGLERPYQSQRTLRYIEENEGEPIQRVLSSADFGVGITEKYEEYENRINTAFATVEAGRGRGRGRGRRTRPNGMGGGRRLDPI